MPPELVPANAPDRFWICGLLSVVGLCSLIAGVPAAVSGARQIAAMMRLPRGMRAGAPHSPAVFGGILEGPPVTTPLGNTATAWVGIVTVTSQGKGHPSWEGCRLGSLEGMQLRLDGGTFAIRSPPISSVDFDDQSSVFPDLAKPAYYQLGRSMHGSPFPDAIVKPCGLNRANLPNHGWSYDEQWVSPGQHVEVVGCRNGNSIVACTDWGGSTGVRVLAADGVDHMTLRLADRAMLLFTLYCCSTLFFAIVGGVGAFKIARAAQRVEERP